MPGFLVEEGSGHLALSWPLLGPLVIISNKFCHCRHIRVRYRLIFQTCTLYETCKRLLSYITLL